MPSMVTVYEGGAALCGFEKDIAIMNFFKPPFYTNLPE